MLCISIYFCIIYLVNLKLSAFKGCIYVCKYVQIAGLPKDSLSVENGVIAQYSQRWPLFIDPQGQANKWIKNMVRNVTLNQNVSSYRLFLHFYMLCIPCVFMFPQERDNRLDVMKLSDRDFLRSLENAIRFGKPCLLENVGEELDPALDPVLLRQVQTFTVWSKEIVE